MAIPQIEVLQVTATTDAGGYFQARFSGVTAAATASPAGPSPSFVVCGPVEMLGAHTVSVRCWKSAAKGVFAPLENAKVTVVLAGYSTVAFAQVAPPGLPA